MQLVVKSDKPIVMITFTNEEQPNLVLKNRKKVKLDTNNYGIDDGGSPTSICVNEDL